MTRRFRNTAFFKLRAPDECISNMYDLVKCSFVVQRSVTCLDLNIGEYSNFRNKWYTDLMPKESLTNRLSKRWQETLHENKVINTEESCKKYFACFRKLLYDFHLDVPRELELSLRNIGVQEIRTCYSTKVLLNKIFLRSDLYETWLLQLIREELDVSSEKVKFIDQLSKVAKRFDFVANDLQIGNKGLVLLCFQRADSIAAHNFLAAMNFPDDYLFSCPLEVFEYVLLNANRTGLNVWPNLSNKDPINTSMYYHSFIRTECLFQYFDAPRFFDDMRTYRVNWRYLLAEDALSILIENNLITRSRYFLIMQIVSVFLDQKGLQALQMVWRSLSEPFITRQEFTFTMPEMPEKEFEHFTSSFVKTVTGEEVMEGLQPRKLEHQCRTIIRRVLKNNRQLATGVEQLTLPDSLKSYLRLKK